MGCGFRRNITADSITAKESTTMKKKIIHGPGTEFVKLSWLDGKALQRQVDGEERLGSY
jgi:hypothetical protein